MWGLCDQDDPAVYKSLKERNVHPRSWAACLLVWHQSFPTCSTFWIWSLLHMRRPGPRSCAMISALAVGLGYEWAKLLWSRCLWRAPFSQRGEPKLNKYLLHPVCIKGLHTWLWRQSDIKQGGVAQPAPTDTCARTHAHFHSLPLKSLSFFPCPYLCPFYSLPQLLSISFSLLSFWPQV